MRSANLMTLLAFGLAAAVHLPCAADGVPWPSRPLRIVVPGGAGGVTDIRARWLAERLAPRLGQSVIVENKPGAGGNVGMEIGARSAPDGHTLTIIHQGVMAVNPHLYGRLGYDPLTDFTPITYLGVGPLLLAVHPAVPAHTVAELVLLARAKPGSLNFGSPGIGTPPHLAGELFKRSAGIDTVHVPYKGGGQAVSDLVAGHLSYSIEGLTVQLPQVKAGRLRALAVTGPRRVASLPEVPTMEEAGLPEAEFQGWVGIAVPAGTPPSIVARLYREIGSILASAEARAWFGEVGAQARADPPEAFAADIRAEHAKWGKVNFFEGVPEGADALLLKSVLHDWDDGPAEAILRNCRRALAPHGRLFVVERIAPERMRGSPHDQGIARSDLNMLVGTGGRERTERQYRELLGAAALTMTRSLALGGPYHAIECVPIEQSARR